MIVTTSPGHNIAESIQTNTVPLPVGWLRLTRQSPPLRPIPRVLRPTRLRIPGRIIVICRIVRNPMELNVSASPRWRTSPKSGSCLCTPQPCRFDPSKSNCPTVRRPRGVGVIGRTLVSRRMFDGSPHQIWRSCDSIVTTAPRRRIMRCSGYQATMWERSL